MIKLIYPAVLSVVLTGCAAVPAAVVLTGGAMDRINASTTEPPQEDAVTVSKYQFFPNATVMAELCKEKLLAERPGTDPSTIKISHSRNILTGVSTCKASV